MWKNRKIDSSLFLQKWTHFYFLLMDPYFRSISEVQQNDRNYRKQKIYLLTSEHSRACSTFAVCTYRNVNSSNFTHHAFSVTKLLEKRNGFIWIYSPTFKNMISRCSNSLRSRFRNPPLNLYKNCKLEGEFTKDYRKAPLFIFPHEKTFDIPLTAV